KISASKRKGLWVGGMVPLGYDSNERRITVNESEANRVRMIFRSYLKLGSLNLLMADLRKQGSQEIDDRSLVHTHVARVEVQPEQLIIQLAEAQGRDRQKAGSNAALQVAWQKTLSRRRRAILSPQQARPIRSENRATLVAS